MLLLRGACPWLPPALCPGARAPRRPQVQASTCDVENNQENNCGPRKGRGHRTAICVWGRGRKKVVLLKPCGPLKPSLRPASTVAHPDGITVCYRHGLPAITLTLPSRSERCQFVVKPLLSTVGSFLGDIQQEDRGIKTARVLSADGTEVAAATPMEVLFKNDFKLVINEKTYDVQSPREEKGSGEPTAEMERVKFLVHRLFTAMHLEELQKKQERHLVDRINQLKGQLLPLEQMKARIEARSEATTSRLLWAGLALLSVQGGALAWFTWWVYSWDIMEPVTYFITVANSMVFFAYFIITRQDSTYTEMERRQFLHFFHRKSEKQHFDVAQYNQLKDDLAKAKDSLRRVRHSLYLRVPVRKLEEKN